jgi:hypothetical protein
LLRVRGRRSGGEGSRAELGILNPANGSLFTRELFSQSLVMIWCHATSGELVTISVSLSLNRSWFLQVLRSSNFCAAESQPGIQICGTNHRWRNCLLPSSFRRVQLALRLWPPGRKGFARYPQQSPSVALACVESRSRHGRSARCPSIHWERAPCACVGLSFRLVKAVTADATM